ncbi:hypothetical protein KFL_000940020 [Klebsormidium nitens]|uniref:Uncharacterized protein n=1 Tax=Klebsormidium nitens TaxID=105231 RepID=A0A1Y1HVQ3_KLENI|nr:hypothetical protein KFL_000940020 [Klebsormidium nitens]|eukprot:GAQ81892.1 hypothetical protein KFL_000940020 [Klebsormidium nitens]
MTLVRALDPQKPAPKKTARQQQSSSIPNPAGNGRGHDFVPQGSFAGYGSMTYQLPHEVPEGAVVISFKLAPEVSLEWLLQFADNLQGLPGLEGETFRGVLVRPDVYHWYALNPDLLYKPWGEACMAAQGRLPAIDHKLEANSKEDAERIERVLRPRTERLTRYEGDVLRRKLIIDD